MQNVVRLPIVAMTTKFGRGDLDAYRLVLVLCQLCGRDSRLNRSLGDYCANFTANKQTSKQESSCSLRHLLNQELLRRKQSDEKCVILAEIRPRGDKTAFPEVQS